MLERFRLVVTRFATRFATGLWLVGATIVTLAVVGGGCTKGGQMTLGVMPGVVNDPGNRSLRRAVLRFGLEEFCKEVTHRGTPLKMRDDDPVIGRFFGRSCTHHELDNGDVFVQLDGIGYTWTNASLRVAFEASAAIQYNQDLLMHGSTMYAYFRTRAIASHNTRVTLVEQPAALGVGVGAVADAVAPRVLRDQLQRGFTVIRDSDGAVDFSVGVIEKGQRPRRPFEIRDSDRMMLANERAEVRGNQLDFLGPFQADSNGQALYLTMLVEGTTAIDAMVVNDTTGEQWLQQFVKTPGVPQPPIPPLAADVVPSGSMWHKTVPVRKGRYYVVLDNSSAVGMVAPPAGGTTPPAALVSVVVQVASAP